ncbi:MAG: helix-turn-helix domain-containing protein [Chthoniobacterales bacterium]
MSIQTPFLQWLDLWIHTQIKSGNGYLRLTANDDRIFRALRIVNTAALDQPLPLKAIEAASGLGSAHLNRLLRIEYGQSLRKIWEHRRLSHARTCLETSRMPIKEIAFILGFQSDSYFMKWFKNLTDLRPKEYRQKHRVAPEVASLT